MWDGIDASWKKRGIYQQPHPPSPPHPPKTTPRGMSMGKVTPPSHIAPPPPKKNHISHPKELKRKNVSNTTTQSTTHGIHTAPTPTTLSQATHGTDMPTHSTRLASLPYHQPTSPTCACRQTRLRFSTGLPHTHAVSSILHRAGGVCFVLPEEDEGWWWYR